MHFDSHPSRPDGDAPAGSESRADLDARLTRTLYEQMKPIAASLLRDSPNLTLQPTAVVNEAYVRLAKNERLEVYDRAHMLSLAAKAMRNLLADHARRKLSAKRGGGWSRLSLSEIGTGDGAAAFDAIDVHEALLRLEALSPRQSRVVELRFFGGLAEREIASVLDVSERTVRSDWRFARAWLRNALGTGA
jgi:RNA polymerase sigma factor (TIGR02999 family)